MFYESNVSQPATCFFFIQYTTIRRRWTSYFLLQTGFIVTGRYYWAVERRKLHFADEMLVLTALYTDFW